MACHLLGTKPLPAPMMYLPVGPSNANISEMWMKIKDIYLRKVYLKVPFVKWFSFSSDLNVLVQNSYTEPQSYFCKITLILISPPV